jgi:hypothetical protein
MDPLDVSLRLPGILRDDVAGLGLWIEEDHDFSAIELASYAALLFFQRAFLRSVVGAITGDKLLDQSIESLPADPLDGDLHERKRRSYTIFPHTHRLPLNDVGNGEAESRAIGQRLLTLGGGTNQRQLLTLRRSSFGFAL